MSKLPNNPRLNFAGGRGYYDTEFTDVDGNLWHFAVEGPPDAAQAFALQQPLYTATLPVGASPTLWRNRPWWRDVAKRTLAEPYTPTQKGMLDGSEKQMRQDLDRINRWIDHLSTDSRLTLRGQVALEQLRRGTAELIQEPVLLHTRLARLTMLQSIPMHDVQAEEVGVETEGVPQRGRTWLPPIPADPKTALITTLTLLQLGKTNSDDPLYVAFLIDPRVETSWPVHYHILARSQWVNSCSTSYKITGRSGDGQLTARLENNHISLPMNPDASLGSDAATDSWVATVKLAGGSFVDYELGGSMSSAPVD